MKTLIDFGFGVRVEVIKSDTSKIHNLKSDKKDVINLGVRLLE